MVPKFNAAKKCKRKNIVWRYSGFLRLPHYVLELHDATLNFLNYPIVKNYMRTATETSNIYFITVICDYSKNYPRQIPIFFNFTSYSSKCVHSIRECRRRAIFSIKAQSRISVKLGFLFLPMRLWLQKVELFTKYKTQKQPNIFVLSVKFEKQKTIEKFQIIFFFNHHRHSNKWKIKNTFLLQKKKNKRTCKNWKKSQWFCNSWFLTFQINFEKNSNILTVAFKTCDHGKTQNFFKQDVLQTCFEQNICNIWRMTILLKKRKKNKEFGGAAIWKFALPNRVLIKNDLEKYCK